MNYCGQISELVKLGEKKQKLIGILIDLNLYFDKYIFVTVQKHQQKTKCVCYNLQIFDLNF